ncbi:hypothetical protein [Pyrococcus abyssi]|nr:hypothetical protein [Pyrococcus abyssi]
MGKMEGRVVIAFEGDGISVLMVEPDGSKSLAKFDMDELVDLVLYRYATPWNLSEDIIEKLFYILNEIMIAYSKNPEAKKEEVIRNIKFRIHENINK